MSHSSSSPALVLAPTPAKPRPRTAWVSVDPQLQLRFKRACARHGVSMHAQAELLIEAWLQDAAAVPRPVTPRQADILAEPCGSSSQGRDGG